MRFLIIASFISLFLACGNKKEKPTAPITPEADVSGQVQLTEAQWSHAHIETAAMGAMEINRTVRVNGRVEVPPGKSVTVTAPIGGSISKLSLITGMKVSKGQALMSLHDQQIIQLQQDYLTAKSKYHFAELEYKRQRELNASQASSDKVLQQAQAEMNYQQIQMSSLAEKLKWLNLQPSSVSTGHIAQSVNLYSTINGYVTAVKVSNGKYVAPGEVLVEVMDPSEMHLRLRVFESDLPSLKVGQSIIAYSNTQPDRPIHCTISLVSQELGADGTAEIHCDFKQVDAALTPGMYMFADIELSSVQANALPESAVVIFEGKHYVFVETGLRTFRMQEVQTGQAHEGSLEIIDTAPLQGKKVVMVGAYTLLMAMKNTAE